jgi:hypothetical protein
MGMIQAADAAITVGGQTYAPSGPTEAMTAPFWSVSSGSAGTYSGLVQLTVSGYGAASGPEVNDTFYGFGPWRGWITSAGWFDGSPVFQLAANTVPLISFWSGGGHAAAVYRIVYDLDAGIEVSPNPTPGAGGDWSTYVPTYRGDHTYHFVIDLRTSTPSPIYFGVIDGGFGDNWGAYNIQITQLAPANQSPDVSAAAPSVAQIWPPNNKMVDIAINGVTDPDGDAVSITITGITNNETGSADAGGIGTATAQVKATRNGKGNGRTYTINFTASDGKGGSASGSVTVAVAHDQGKRAKPAAVESATWGEVKDWMR